MSTETPAPSGTEIDRVIADLRHELPGPCCGGPAIHHNGADMIERLRAEVATLTKRLDCAERDLTATAYGCREALDACIGWKAEVDTLRADISALRHAISADHADDSAWDIHQIATLAQAHRSDSEAADAHTPPGAFDNSPDYEAVAIERLAMASALSTLLSGLEAMEQQWSMDTAHANDEVAITTRHHIRGIAALRKAAEQ